MLILAAQYHNQNFMYTMLNKNFRQLSQLLAKTRWRKVTENTAQISKIEFEVALYFGFSDVELIKKSSNFKFGFKA